MWLPFALKQVVRMLTWECRKHANKTDQYTKMYVCTIYVNCIHGGPERGRAIQDSLRTLLGPKPTHFNWNLGLNQYDYFPPLPKSSGRPSKPPDNRVQCRDTRACWCRTRTQRVGSGQTAEFAAARLAGPTDSVHAARLGSVGARVAAVGDWNRQTRRYKWGQGRH